MRKYFEGLSFVEGALILAIFSFGFFLRFFDLKIQSPWTDELASWYYLRNLKEVFLHESHPPFYYGILRLFLGSDPSIYALRLFSASISSLSLIIVFHLAKKVFGIKKAAGILILLALNPADIVHSRMARHYAIFLEGTLIYYLLVKANAKTWLLSILAFFLGFIHIFALIPVFCVSCFELFKNRSSDTIKRYTIIEFASFGVILYYILRVWFFGSGKVGSNVIWNHSYFWQYLHATVLQFLGDAAPRNAVYPTNEYLAYCLLIPLMIYLCFKRRESFYFLISVFLLSVFSIEILKLFWVNLRIARCMIYLCGFLSVAFIDSINEVKFRHLAGIFIVCLGIILTSNLTTNFPWDDQAVDEFKELANFEKIPVFVCSNRFQQTYYGLQGGLSCGDRIDEADTSKPLIYFDLNSNDNHVALHLMDAMNTRSFKKINHSVLIHFIPKMTDSSRSR